MAEIFTCTICGQSFEDDGQLKDHMINLHTAKQEKENSGEPPAHNPVTGQGGE